MSDEILQPIQDSQHSSVLSVFEDALRSGKYISIDGGALPVALDDVSGEIYHGSFDKGAYRSTGTLVRDEGYEVDTAAFEISVRLMHYAQKNGAEASLSFALWDMDGVPLDQRNIFKNRLIANNNLESLPLVYQKAAEEVLASKQQARDLFAQIQIMPQSLYGHSLSNCWRDVKAKIRKADNAETWAREHFNKTGQIFLEAWEGEIKYSFLSTLLSRQPFKFTDMGHASEKVRSEGALPIALADQTLCGPISGGRIYEMRKKARARSDLAKQKGVYTISIQDTGVDTDSLQKMARGVFFQEMGAYAEFDRSAAYIFSPKPLTSGQVIQLPERWGGASFDEALEIACTRIADTVQLENATVFGIGRKTPSRPVDQATQKAARMRFSWARNAQKQAWPAPAVGGMASS